MRLGRDGIAALVVLAASTTLFVLTLGLKASALVPFGPGFYPRIVLGITIFFSLLMLIGDVLARRRAQAGTSPTVPAAAAATPAHRPNYALVAIHFALFGVYVMALPGLGFRIATLLYVAIANVLLAMPRGLRGWAGTLALAAGTAFISHFIFETQLSVLLPRGSWTGF